MPDNFTGLDLGKNDYQSESGNDDILGLSKFTSKPSPKPYQPFGGPIQQAPQTFAQPQYYEQPKTPEPKNYNVFSDDELDTYERAKKDYSYVNNYATSAGQIASKRKANYDEFMKGKLMPFFEQIGGFGEFDDDDELAASIDEMESLTKATSQMDDGWFGPSDEKVAAGENLKNFKLWSSPNGLRDQYRRLRAERDRYQGIADAYKSEKIARLEQLTSIPIPAKQALDDALKSRGKKSSSSPAKRLRSGSGSSKDVNSLLDGMQFEQPMYDGSGLANPESVDPRSSVLFDDIYGTEKKRQSERMGLANRGDVKGLLSRRQHIARERQLRDKGFFFSESGLLDGRPIGLSRRDVDLLDIDDMRKAGMTSYQGRPLDEAMAELGGEERLEMAKVMESVYSAKSNYEDAQLAFLKVAGGAGAEKAREKMDEAREKMEKSIGLAAGYGLDNELFEQAETTGWLSALGNAIDRGMLMSEMSNYAPDFLTNTLDADEMQRFIEIASEMEKLPTSSTMKRYKESDKSGGFFEAIGKLLFDNTGAIPELFFESMSAFLPATIKWFAPTAGAGAATGAAIGTAVAPGAGTLAGAKVGGLWGARLSFASASFVLEASGMALESMQELNIDWKNPKVFAAAWTNESIRNKIQKKMVQKGIPIAIADAMSGMMAGKVMGVVNHTGNAAFKGGKLLNKEAFNKANAAVPRFTLMQRTRNASAEIGADSLMGMSGEYLGQWASKEPGEDWDWDAVAAEGAVGVGPGVFGAALAMRGPRANYFGNAPIEISGEQKTQSGSMGTVNRAGYSAPYQTFNDPESMMAHFEDVVPEGATPEEQDSRAASLDFTRRWVNTMFKIRPEAMAGLKIAISPRTPDANLKNRGTFESRDGHNIIYLNEKEFAQDPMAALFHESGHFARLMLLNEQELMKLWGGLKDTEQLDAYTQYYTKEYDKSFEDHDEKTQKKIRSAFNKTDNEVLAEEWFSYQWARVLNANYKPDPSVKGLEKFYTGLVRPMFAEFTGTENVAGNKKGDELVIDEQIRRFLEDGFTPSMQSAIDGAQAQINSIRPEVGQDTGSFESSRDQIRSQLEQKLKAMRLAPKKAAQVARTLNAMAGEKILSTDPSFYTPMNRAAVAAMGADIEEGKQESEKRPENQDPTFIEEAATGYSEETKTVSRSEDNDKFGGKQPLKYEKQTVNNPKIKKSPEDSAKEIKLKENLKKKVAEYNPINQRLLKLQQKFKSKRTSEEAKKKLSQKIDSIIPEADKLRSEIDQIKKDIDGLYAPLARKTEFQARDAEMKRLDSLLKNMSKSDRIKIEQMIKGIERSFQDLDSVDNKIDDAIEALGGYFVTDPGDRPTPFRKGQLISKDKYEEVLAEGPPLGFTAEKGPGENASSGQIISQILNLEELTKLAPRSFTEEMRNLLQESRIKMASNEDIEDISLQITEEIYGIKEQLRTRRDEIDKEIASLEKGLDPEAQKPKEKVEGQRIEDEIKELNKAKDWVELFLQAVAPEDLTIDWKDIPARGIFYSPNGQSYTAKPLTLGMLAVRDEAFGKDQLFYKTKDEDRPQSAKNESRTGVEILWDHINKFSLDESGTTQEFGTDPDGKKITPRKYQLYLEAAKASAFYPQSAKPNEDGGVGSNPMGSPRFEKTESGNVEAQKGYPAGFQSEKGTNYAALIAERLKNKKRRSSLSDNPSPTEILALKMANGRSLELLGDPSETERDFNKAMYIALLEEEGVNQSGMITDEDLVEQADYAEGEEYERSALEKISMGTPVVAAMAGIPSVSKRKQIQEKALDADAQSAVTDRSATGKKDRPDESSPVWEDYGKEGRKKDTPKVKRKETKEVVLNTNGFQVPTAYQAKRPNEDLSETVEATEVHDSFTRGKIYQTFDVISSFAKGRSKEEITSFGLGWSKKLPKFNKRRTNIQKSEELPANPISMSRDQADLLSTTDINAADFAEWYMSGKPEEQMANLQLVPSSKNNQQAKGGLGEGMLPFVFFEFAQNMYDKLGLKNRQAMYKKAREAEEAVAKDKKNKYHNFQWDLEKGKLLKGGKLDPDIKVFVNKNKRFSPVGMAVLARPIVQAVIDAEGVDIYNKIDKNESAILARDIERGEQSIERDDSGNEDTQVAEKAPEIDQSAGAPKASNTKFRKGSPTLDAIAADRRKTLIREEFDKIKERVGISKKNSAILAEATKIADQKIQRELDSSMTENFKKAQQSSKPKTLNSDARTLTSDADPNLSKLSLLTRLASAKDEYKKDAKAWAKAKKESLKEGSFKMNLVDRADPLKQYHRGIFKVLKKAGLDEKSKLYSFLNTHGRYHQYFGKGYNTVEQAQLNYIQPLKDLLREYGISQTDFGRYLIARAAPSRNLQLKARIDEMLADFAKEEKGGVDSEAYEKERAKYYDGNTLKVNAGLDTDTAVETVKEIEANVKNFKQFAEKALPIYYAMNLESLNNLTQSGMIQEGVATIEGKPAAMKEETAMVRAMSRYKWAEEHPDVVQVDWSILDTPPPKGAESYSYAPLQGFEGETEQYFDNEAAWEEFGAGSNATGKGMDQPKSKILLTGAFGRDGKTKGPNPDLVFANSINQFFDNSIRAHKNEVAQSFGTLYESILRIVYPEKAKEFEGENIEARNKAADKTILTIEQALGDNREALVKELKKEFDKIFEPEFKEYEIKKMYEVKPQTLAEGKTGDAKIMAVTRTLSTQFREDPTVFVYRRDGVPKFIKLKETPEGLRMADAMKNLKYETLPSVLNFFNIGTRGMAQMFTSMNPAFLIPNFFRDIGTAAIHLSEDHKKKIWKDAMNLKTVGTYVKAIIKAEVKIGSNINPQKDPEIRELMKLSAEELAKAKGPKADIARYQYAKKQGSKIGYFRHKSVPDLIQEINKEIKKNKAPTESLLSKTANYVDSINTGIENGIRISSFWAAVKNGFSVDEAAVIARNVTVDFNQKGNLTQAFGSLYVFFGASVNSMHRFVTTFKRRSPKERRNLIGGIMAASMAVALFNRLMDDDEDEEMPDYDTISSYKRDTNLIIPVPAGLPGFFNDEKDTGYFSMPLPLGYNLFWTMGQVAADFVASSVFNRGGTGLIGGITRVKDSAMNAFNPIGGATLATIGMPTIFTPPMELYANKNFMGRPIRYDDQPFEVPKPAHMQDPKSTPQHWNDLSKAINEFMGGSDVVKGSLAGIGGGNPLEYASDDDLKFDMSGNQMRHILMGYLGGPGQIADAFLGSLYTAGTGKESIKTIGDVPILNRFMRATTYGATTRDTFYELRNAVKTAEKAIKTAKEIGPEAYSLVLQDNRKLVQLSSQISALDKQKNKLRRLRNKIEASKALSEEQKTQRVDEIQKKELNLMVAVIKKAQSLGIS